MDAISLSNLPLETYGWIIFFISLVGLAVWLSRVTKRNEEGFIKINKEQKEKIYLDHNFKETVSRVLNKTHSILLYTFISMDEKQNKLFVQLPANLENKEGTQKIIEAKDIMSVDVVSDAETITSTKRGSQAIGVAAGAILLGGVGAIIGGLSGKTKTKKTIGKLTLKINIDDVLCPSVSLIFYSGIQLPINSSMCKKNIEDIDEWENIIKIMMRREEESK